MMHQENNASASQSLEALSIAKRAKITCVRAFPLQVFAYARFTADIVFIPLQEIH